MLGKRKCQKEQRNQKGPGEDRELKGIPMRGGKGEGIMREIPIMGSKGKRGCV